MPKFDPSAHFAPDRLDKLRDLREAGVDPYPHEFDRTGTIGSFVDRYDDREEIDDDETHRLAGRITGNIRDLGSVAFLDITDETGTVQLFFHEDTLAEYDLLDSIDRGDVVGATGEAIRTNTGELSVAVESFTVLSKALLHPPGPEGLSTDQRIRNRAVAMWDEDLRAQLDTRFAVIREIRAFLHELGYTEVETPILQNVTGGTRARPFETHLNAKGEDVYLRIAKELYLKRMVVGGYEQVFEIGKDFRNEDIDSTHNPEFTMLELYRAYADYEDMMTLTEELVAHLLETVVGSTTLTYDGETIDFSPPFERLTVREAIERHADIDVTALSDEELRERAQEAGGEFPGGFTRGDAEMELFDHLVEEHLQDPTFVTDHPKESTPLCKDHRSEPGRIERFELFAAGAELGNAYTELNDPVEQGELFAQQAERRERGDEEAHQTDEEFIRALGYGMPPTGGLGIGVDRLVMLVTDTQSIKEVIPFPMVAQQNQPDEQ